MRRVLVTGATGFVGRHTLAPLRAREFEIHATQHRLAPPSTEGVRWHELDLLDHRATQEAIRAICPTHLLHLAWFVDPATYAESPNNLDWSAASISLARAFAEAGGHRIVGAGTCAEYAASSEALNERSSELNPRTLYATCKDATRRVFEAHASRAGLSCAWGRIFHPYGPHEPTSRLVPTVIRSLLARQAVPLSRGDQALDLIHVQDLAHAFVALLASGVEGPVNLGTGVNTTVRQVAERVGTMLRGLDLLRFGELTPRATDAQATVADVRRLVDEVGCKPSFGLDEGLSNTIDWWRRNERLTT